MPEGDAPKIIIDSDWKSQAQAEKDRLAAEEERKRAASRPAPTGAPRSGAADAALAGDRIPANFEELLRLLATQALLYMGAFPDPQTGRAVVALDYARLHIDLLDVLAQKTKGNLTPDEDSLLTQTLSELRLQYVEIARAVGKAIEEGRIAPMGRGAPAPAGGTPPSNPAGVPPRA